MSIIDKKNLKNLDFLGVCLQEKQRSTTEKFERFAINLASLYLVGLHFFLEARASVSLKVSTKGFITDKKSLEIYIIW